MERWVSRWELCHPAEPCPAPGCCATTFPFPRSHTTALLLQRTRSLLIPPDPAHRVRYNMILGALMLQYRNSKYVKCHQSTASSYTSFIHWGFWFCSYSGKGVTEVASDDGGYKNTKKQGCLYSYMFCMNKLYKLVVEVNYFKIYFLCIWEIIELT